MFQTQGEPTRSVLEKRAEVASFILTAAALILILRLHLLVAFLAGLLVFELVHMIAPMLQRQLADRRALIGAVAILAAVIVGIIMGLAFGIVAFLKSEAGSVPALMNKMAEIIESAKGVLPPWIMDHIPATVEGIRDRISAWLREHAAQVRLIGAETARAFVMLLIGMIIGAMVALHEAAEPTNQKPLALALIKRAEGVGDAFRRVVFAQVRISALNTIFTAIYLLAVLPLFGVNLPYAKTLVVLTFITGLLPVIGNLISNTVIVTVSLAVSVAVALASLAFLIVIHKLEYFLNARIVGTRIEARPWEVLIAMLGMEAAFGLPGLVAAPIYYAYIKRELSRRGLV